MIDADRKEPAVNRPPHSVTSNATVLTSLRRPALPEPAYLARRTCSESVFTGTPKGLEVLTCACTDAGFDRARHPEYRHETSGSTSDPDLASILVSP
jgi:hypothetical protein